MDIIRDNKHFSRTRSIMVLIAILMMGSCFSLLLSYDPPPRVPVKYIVTCPVLGVDTIEAYGTFRGLDGIEFRSIPGDYTYNTSYPSNCSSKVLQENTRGY